MPLQRILQPMVGPLQPQSQLHKGHLPLTQPSNVLMAISVLTLNHPLTLFRHDEEEHP